MTKLLFVGVFASAGLLLFSVSQVFGFTPIPKEHVSDMLSVIFLCIWGGSIITCIGIFIEGMFWESIIGYVIALCISVVALSAQYGIGYKDHDFVLMLWGGFLFLGMPLGNLILLGWYSLHGWPKSAPESNGV